MHRPKPAATRTALLDAALVLALAGASLLLGAEHFLDTAAHDKMVHIFGSEQLWRQHVVWWWAAAVPVAAAIPLRHRWPPAAVGLAAAGAAVHLLDPEMPRLPLDLAVVLCVYAYAGAATARRLSLVVLGTIQAALYALCVTVLATGGFGPADDDLSGKGMALWGPSWQDSAGALLDGAAAAAVPALLIGIAWALGDAARIRRAHLAAVQGRAADAEREQNHRTALAIAAERGRITRELHDVVAHGLSVIVVQAQAADAALDRHPERTRLALANVIATGRGSLAEMRRLLGLVHGPAGDTLAPQPTLAMLPDLIDRVRAAGTTVHLHVSGEPLTLPSTVELSAFRIVQEALTNTLKHAGAAASCRVALTFDSAGLHILVRDTGQATQPVTPGNGLRGITERVAALGGTFRAGPAAGGGFEVAATLPVVVTA